MLTEFLRSFILPGLEKKYIVADDSLTEEGAAADSKKVGQELAKKVDKETGKALSTNDYTNAEKTKLAGVDSGAQVNTIEGVKVDGTEVTPDAQKKVNLNVYDKAAINAIVQEIYAEVAKKLNIDGYSEAATVGNALGLVTDSVVEDKEPYNFRSLAHLPVGKFCYDTLVGGSVVWNQLIKNGNFESVNTWTTQGYGNYTVSNNIGDITITVANSSARIEQPASPIEGHKYLATADMKADFNTAFTITFGGVGAGAHIARKGGVEANTWTRVTGIRNAAGSDLTAHVIRLYFGSDNSTVGDQVYIKNVMLIDLTAALGSTIADYVYSLETATAGAGVAWFRKYFPGVYYGYSEPHFEHVQTSAKETVGFNQWDEEWEKGRLNTQGEPQADNSYIRSKNFIPILPSTQYCIGMSLKGASAAIGMFVFYYDGNQSFISAETAIYSNWADSNFLKTTPANAHYAKFYISSNYGTTYKNDICINLHGDRDGEYEAYKKRTYPLDSSLTLRGISMLDSANRMYFDGDIYRHDGSGEQRYSEYTFTGGETWTFFDAGEKNTFNCVISGAKSGGNGLMAGKYAWSSVSVISLQDDKTFIFFTGTGGTRISVCDSAYSDVDAFKASMAGVKLLFEKATPEPFTAEPYQYPMVVDPLGTEEFVDYAVEQGERDVKIPCGHTSEYPEDLVDKLEVLPHATGTNGDYLITEINGKLYLKPYTQTVGLTSVSETEAE